MLNPGHAGNKENPVVRFFIPAMTLGYFLGNGKVTSKKIEPNWASARTCAGAGALRATAFFLAGVCFLGVLGDLPNDSSM